MEYPTFATAANCSTTAHDTLSQVGLDVVNIHEFGHGYFYGILASNEFEEPLLDEGLNEYWDQRMLRDRRQKLHVTTPFWSAVGLHPVWNVFEAERMGAPREEPADPIGQNAYDRLQSIGAVYSRTAVTLRDLEARIGKEATERAFKAYYARWKFRHPSVADLRESLAEASGQRGWAHQNYLDRVGDQQGTVEDRDGGVIAPHQVEGDTHQLLQTCVRPR